MAATTMNLLWKVMRRDEGADADDDDSSPAGQKEEDASRSLFILISLLIIALFVSYILQTRRIQAIHETVISILAGSFVGLILRLTANHGILNAVIFRPQLFFNMLLPPIILASGYELHQQRFFRHIGTILTFAFAGTFISAIVLGILIWLWNRLPFEFLDLSFVEAISLGATLSATDPVTILAIFNTYKVDPKLYTVIFGESLLNDAIAIVLFHTAAKYTPRGTEDNPNGSLTPLKLLESFGVFLLVFFGSLLVGVLVGIGTSLFLKFTYVRRFPKIESCIVLLIAYASYFFANSIELSGIVSLLFCGICYKHYAYHNMSRRTQLTIKFLFQILSQLSENFIFIYLGVSLFAENKLDFRAPFILITVIGVCVSRWMAVFPLSAAINWINRYRQRRQGAEETDIMPWSYQAMLFWAGLRGAVGVALAAEFTGPKRAALKATVLVVVVLTVIIFGGTTARMLEILNIRTGVVEDVDSDDEFDIEVVRPGTYAKRSGTAFGHNPKSLGDRVPLSTGVNGDGASRNGIYSSARGMPPDRPSSAMARKNSALRLQRDDENATQGLLRGQDLAESDDEGADLDLPPSVRRVSPGPSGLRHEAPARTSSAPVEGPSSSHASRERQDSSGGIRQFFQGSSGDPATWFRHFDEDYIKPTLLLDPKDGTKGPGAV